MKWSTLRKRQKYVFFFKFCRQGKIPKYLKKIPLSMVDLGNYWLFWSFARPCQVIQTVQRDIYYWKLFFTNNIVLIQKNSRVLWTGRKTTKKVPLSFIRSDVQRKNCRTRLTYNCAHLRSTKESLTLWVKFFWVKIFWVNFFWVKIFLGENFLGENFWVKFFWVKFFCVKKIFGWKFLGW